MAATGTAERAPEPAAEEIFVRRTLGQLVRVALGYRALVTLVAVAITAAAPDLTTAERRRLVGLAVAIVLVHVAVVPWSRPPLRAATPWLVGADIAVAVFVNLWASAAAIPDGQLYRGYGDPFGAYAIGTLALWTALKGPRVGAGLLAGVMLPLQLAMAAVNRANAAASDWARFVMRSLWLVAALVVGWLLWSALRRGATALAAQSELAGRQAHRRRTLDALHNVVLQTLIGMERRAANPIAERQVLCDIGVECRRQAGEVRTLLESGRPPGTGVFADVRRLVGELGCVSQARIDVAADGSEPLLSADAADALVGAVGEAVRNAARHAGASRVTVELEADADQIRAVVGDDGCGFDLHDVGPGYGIRNTIRRRLVEVGGSARLLTAPGEGTTWDMAVPRAADRSPGGAAAAAVELLVERTVASYAFIPLAYRAVGLLIATAGLVASTSLGPLRQRHLVAVLLGLAVLQVGLIAVAARFPHLLRRPGVVAGDVAALAGLSLWAASVLPAGTVFFDNRDPLTIYAQGTVALWTGFGSTVLGLVLLPGLGLLLPVLGAAVNGVPIGSVDWLTVAARGMWLAAAFLLARGVVSTARSGGLLLAADRHRAGVEAERAGTLEVSAHEVLATLERIGRRAEEDNTDPIAALKDVGAMARRQAVQVRLLLHTADLELGGLQAELEMLVARFQERGTLRLELVAVDLPDDAPAELKTSLIEVLGQLLEAAEGTGPARTLKLFVESCDGRVRAVLRDPGRARHLRIDAALSESLAAQLPASGSEVVVTPTSEGGRTWEILIPL